MFQHRGSIYMFCRQIGDVVLALFLAENQPFVCHALLDP